MVYCTARETREDWLQPARPGATRSSPASWGRIDSQVS